jgi:hypothetical protein
MTVDVMFPLYNLLVNNIFGSMGLAIIGVGVTLLLILIVTRSTSPIFLMMWMLFYFITMFSLLPFGTLALVLAGFIGLVLVIINMLRLIARQSD